MKKLSIILFGVLLILCLALIPMKTQAATEGYLTYEIENGEVTITDCDEDAYGKIVIPDTIEGYPVTKIGKGAFWDCTGIKEIVVPNSITVIPDGAFKECETLTKITLPEGLISIGDGAFIECGYLTDITIPESVTSIGGGAFLFCERLTSIAIPEGVRKIEDSTFECCSSLKNVTLPDSVTAIGDFAFRGCPLGESFVLPKNVSSIGDFAFGRITVPEDHPYFTVDAYGVLFTKDKETLVRAMVTIEGKYEVPEGVQIIQGYALAGQNKMTEIVFPNTVTKIGPHGLSGIGAASVTLPDGLTTVESGLMTSCKNLVDVYIPDSVTRIESEAFRSCYDLRNIRLSNNLEYIGQWAFAYDYFSKISLPVSLREIDKGAFSTSSLREVTYAGTLEQWNAIAIGEYNDEVKNATLIIQSIQPATPIEGYLYYVVGNGEIIITDCDPEATGVIVIPETIQGYPVTTIDQRAFANIKNIAEVTLPSSVKTIKDWAFTESSIKRIVIPESVTSISKGAFYFCNQLEDAMLPDHITEIPQNAFGGCTALKNIHLPASLQTIEKSAFERCLSLESVVIPEGITVISKSAFAACRSLAEIVLPPNLTTIGHRAFVDCAFTEINIPDRVTSIADQAFYTCSNLTQIVLPASLTTIGPNAFGECSALTKVNYSGSQSQWNAIDIDVGNDELLNAKLFGQASTPNQPVKEGYLTYSIKSGKAIVTDCDENVSGALVIPEKMNGFPVTGIEESAFWECNKLTEITIPASVNVIADGAFRCSRALQHIWVAEENPNYVSDSAGVLYSKNVRTILAVPLMLSGHYTVADGTVYIGKFAFFNCGEITKVTLPESLSSIKDFAFCHCEKLESINLSKWLDFLGSSAFYRCISLKTIAIPKGVTEILNGTFGECLALETIELPDSITNVEYGAFAGCGITKIYLPNVTEIGDIAFDGCRNLKEVTLGEKLTYIGQAAFRGCWALEEIYLPATVKEIVSGAFTSCLALQKVIYGGSQAQWNEIQIGGLNESLVNAQLVCQVIMPTQPTTPTSPTVQPTIIPIPGSSTAQTQPTQPTLQVQQTQQNDPTGIIVVIAGVLVLAGCTAIVLLMRKKD